jgi:hypothetical protein
MKIEELKGIMGCFALLLMATAAWSTPAPDTGQTKGDDLAGKVIVRASHGMGLYCRYGNSGSNPSSYTKLDDSGNPLQDYASSWIMVKDNVTGLIWEMKTNKDGVKNYSDPHDADNTYAWFDSNPATNGGYVGTPDKGKDTKAFIDALNSARFGGYSDWRLPTLKELNAIVNYEIPPPGPTIDAAYFPNTQSSFYWSSTTGTGYEYRAWVVGFDDGYGHNYGKYGYYYVRGVRGRQAGGAPDLKTGGQDEKLQFAFVPQDLVEDQSAGLTLPKDLPFPVLLDPYLHIAD